jgi:hypothetical protein
MLRVESEGWGVHVAVGTGRSDAEWEMWEAAKREREAYCSDTIADATGIAT